MLFHSLSPSLSCPCLISLCCPRPTIRKPTKICCTYIRQSPSHVSIQFHTHAHTHNTFILLFQMSFFLTSSPSLHSLLHSHLPHLYLCSSCSCLTLKRTVFFADPSTMKGEVFPDPLSVGWPWDFNRKKFPQVSKKPMSSCFDEHTEILMPWRSVAWLPGSPKTAVRKEWPWSWWSC